MANYRVQVFDGLKSLPTLESAMRTVMAVTASSHCLEYLVPPQHLIAQAERSAPFAFGQSRRACPIGTGIDVQSI